MFHLSKMDRSRYFGRTVIAEPPVPTPAPILTKDPRIAEAKAILRANRGNFIDESGDESRWLVKLADGTWVVATRAGPYKVVELDEPDSFVRGIYPAMFPI